MDVATNDRPGAVVPPRRSHTGCWSHRSARAGSPPRRGGEGRRPIGAVRNRLPAPPPASAGGDLDPGVEPGPLQSAVEVSAVPAGRRPAATASAGQLRTAWCDGRAPRGSPSWDRGAHFIRENDVPSFPGMISSHQAFRTAAPNLSSPCRTTRPDAPGPTGCADHQHRSDQGDTHHGHQAHQSHHDRERFPVTTENTVAGSQRRCP